MATFESLFIMETGTATKFTASATSAGTAQQFKGKFLIYADGDFQLEFGGSAVAASSGSMYIPGSSLLKFDTGEATYFSVYNPGSSTLNIFYKRVGSN